MKFEIKRKIIRQSDNHFTETAIQPQLVNNKSEFNARSYFKYPGQPDKENDLQVLEISNKYGRGVNVEIFKVGEKRTNTLSFSLGADQIDILIEYLQSIQGDLANYAGELIHDGLYKYSPWHSCIAIRADGTLETIHRKDGLERGYELVNVDGRPYYFQEV